MKSTVLQQFKPLFAEIKSRFDSRFDERPSVANGLICKQGFYTNSLVLKLQKASWTNDPMDRIRNQSGIFFSIWITEKSTAKNRANYNIHALKLRHLKGYSIASRDFAEDFRNRFASLQKPWPNVSIDYGPLTLMQGCIDIQPQSAERSILLLMKSFEHLSPLIDQLLDSRRRFPTP